jgi:hypothetical protein
LLLTWLFSTPLVWAQEEQPLAAAQTSRAHQAATALQPSTEKEKKRLPSAKQYYQGALEEIQAMLEGRQPASFKRAVFLTENAYYNNTLPYQGFEDYLSAIVDTFRQIVEANGQDYATNRQARNQALFTYLTDTLQLIHGADTLTRLPFRYNFDDFTGEKDWRKMFVSLLLTTRKGNCHSLPYLYKIMAEQMDIEAYLSVAPNHLYIKHRTDGQLREWFNLELTSGTFPSDAWLMASGYMSQQSIISGIYADTLSLKQSLSLCLLDLAKGYERKFGQVDAFNTRCIELALAYYPNSINALL